MKQYLVVFSVGAFEEDPSHHPGGVIGGAPLSGTQRYVDSESIPWRMPFFGTRPACVIAEFLFMALVFTSAKGVAIYFFMYIDRT